MAKGVKKIGDLLNGDLTDPLNLNILIYTSTYVLSIISSILPCVGTFGTDSFNVTEFLRILTDCIVPTTATLVLGNVIQNFVSVSQTGIKRFALSIWALLAVIAYMILYPAFRWCESYWFSVIVWLVSAGIVVLGMHAIVQIEKESHKDIKSLSG